ncbi:hypothetical protein [Paenibacillus rhizophilus]|uniref:Uncharacterized protein n=1 Tax=Paenibacillus rhizophilus TaxID=1850366 RepID=A0A3N9P1A1_9BACL|nr:hypothetical protein [Paenibacillus rhizophilus]RQW09489.1 hypothetical protein EH198_18610 [Paenibacillus rhizophilus]
MKSRIHYLLDCGDHYNRIEAAGEKERTDSEWIGTQDEEARGMERCRIREEEAAYHCTAERLSGMRKDESGQPARAVPLFWSFPEGRGARQPWRRRLWEHRRDEL